MQGGGIEHVLRRYERRLRGHHAVCDGVAQRDFREDCVVSRQIAGAYRRHIRQFCFVQNLQRRCRLSKEWWKVCGGARQRFDQDI